MKNQVYASKMNENSEILGSIKRAISQFSRTAPWPSLAFEKSFWEEILKIMKNQVYAIKMDGNWKKNIIKKQAISQFIQTLRVPGHFLNDDFDENLIF